MRRPVILHHHVRSPRWRAEPVTIAVLSDFHVVSPWAPLRALAGVVDRVNALAPDIILLPGDFLAGRNLGRHRASAPEIVAVLEHLSAPLGVHATLGNHDWADCAVARETGGRRNSVAEALEASNRIAFYPNCARDLGRFWLVGIDSIIGARERGKPRPRHDPEAAFAPVPTGADVILMAHEPDFWVDERPDAALTVSGHTHGGQIVLGDWRPLTPSRHGGRFAHGLHSDGDRHMVVSGGLGYSGVPIRFGVPPEITVIRLSGDAP